MSERTYPLPSGDELSIEANESVWLRTGDLKGLISDSSLLIQVLALVDSLQQQLESNNLMVSRIGELKRQLRVVSLREKMAEKDRTIARLTKELEEARRNLNIQQAKIKMLEVDNEMLESMVGQEREDDNDEAVRLRKALEDAREAVTHLTGEHPTELWTKSEIDGWRGIGESAIDNINQALGRK
ncbi:hypothetical protein G3M74_13200 [Paenibacillus polymyxa]|nr:hypothetical protein [Paenibacillus polymyxa]